MRYEQDLHHYTIIYIILKIIVFFFVTDRRRETHAMRRRIRELGYTCPIELQILEIVI